MTGTEEISEIDLVVGTEPGQIDEQTELIDGAWPEHWQAGVIDGRARPSSAVALQAMTVSVGGEDVTLRLAEFRDPFVPSAWFREV